MGLFCGGDVEGEGGGGGSSQVWNIPIYALPNLFQPPSFHHHFNSSENRLPTYTLRYTVNYAIFLVSTLLATSSISSFLHCKKHCSNLMFLHKKKWVQVFRYYTERNEFKFFVPTLKEMSSSFSFLHFCTAKKNIPGLCYYTDKNNFWGPATSNIKRWNFGIGALKQFGTTSVNFVSSKITPP